MKKILVIGESSKDIFVYCDAIRLCPDIPVPVLNILNQTENPGMAKNVHRNILSRIKECDLVTNWNWNSISKTRYVHEKTNHLFLRVDSPDKISRIDLNKIDYGYEILVISDYNKGFLSREDIRTICRNHPKVFVDTKKILGDWIQDAAFIKINDFEYKNSLSSIEDSFRNKIIHTTGADGCEFGGKKFPVKKVDVQDSSGAGDTFMAALVIKYFETSDIVESIAFANECASRVVAQRGITTL